jgi:hypothetical protein
MTPSHTNQIRRLSMSMNHISSFLTTISYNDYWNLNDRFSLLLHMTVTSDHWQRTSDDQGNSLLIFDLQLSRAFCDAFIVDIDGTDMSFEMIAIVRAHLYLICEILFILLCLVQLNLRYTTVTIICVGDINRSGKRSDLLGCTIRYDVYSNFSFFQCVKSLMCTFVS